MGTSGIFKPTWPTSSSLAVDSFRPFTRSNFKKADVVDGGLVLNGTLAHFPDFSMISLVITVISSFKVGLCCAAHLGNDDSDDSGGLRNHRFLPMTGLP